MRFCGFAPVRGAKGGRRWRAFWRDARGKHQAILGLGTALGSA